jgi:hypothetical protein
MSILTAACCAAFFVLAFNVVLATDACGLPTIAILHALATLVG